MPLNNTKPGVHASELYDRAVGRGIHNTLVVGSILSISVPSGIFRQNKKLIEQCSLINYADNNAIPKRARPIFYYYPA